MPGTVRDYGQGLGIRGQLLDWPGQGPVPGPWCITGLLQLGPGVRSLSVRLMERGPRGRCKLLSRKYRSTSGSAEGGSAPGPLRAGRGLTSGVIQRTAESPSQCGEQTAAPNLNRTSRFQAPRLVPLAVTVTVTVTVWAEAVAAERPGSRCDSFWGPGLPEPGPAGEDDSRHDAPKHSH